MRLIETINAFWRGGRPCIHRVSHCFIGLYPGSLLGQGSVSLTRQWAAGESESVCSWRTGRERERVIGRGEVGFCQCARWDAVSLPFPPFFLFHTLIMAMLKDDVALSCVIGSTCWPSTRVMGVKSVQQVADWYWSSTFSFGSAGEGGINGNNTAMSKWPNCTAQL